MDTIFLCLMLVGIAALIVWSIYKGSNLWYVKGYDKRGQPLRQTTEDILRDIREQKNQEW